MLSVRVLLEVVGVVEVVEVTEVGGPEGNGVPPCLGGATREVTTNGGLGVPVTKVVDTTRDPVSEVRGYM